jgi:hypothetical protein
MELAMGVRDGSKNGLAAGDGLGDSVGSGVVEGLGVVALVGLGISADGAAQAASKSSSAVKAIAFLIPLSLPLLCFFSCILSLSSIWIQFYIEYALDGFSLRSSFHLPLIADLNPGFPKLCTT